jgi:hypothetical protein
MKEIHVCSNKGSGPLQRGDDHKNRVESFKTLLLQNHWANLTRLGTNHPWGERIQVFSNEGDSPSSAGDNSERVKIH